MPQHKKHASSALFIKLDDPSAPLYPGSFVRGRVYRKWPTNDNVTLSVRLMGRAKAKFTTDGQVEPGETKKVRLRHPFWGPDAISKVLHEGLLATSSTDEHWSSWAFELKIPPLTNTSANTEGAQQLGFATEKHSLPASYACITRRDGKAFEAFVEYWLEAALQTRPPYGYWCRATLPLEVLAAPSPETISDFMLDNQMFGSVSWKGWSDPLGGYQLSIEFPRVLQAGADIPFRIRLVPSGNESSLDTGFKPQPPKVFIIDAEFTITTDTYILYPDLRFRNRLTTYREPRPMKKMTQIKDPEVALAVPNRSEDEPVDLGKLMGLRLDATGRLLGASLARVKAAQTVAPEIVTYCMRTENTLVWEIHFWIDGKSGRLKRGLQVRVVPPSSSPTDMSAADKIPSPADHK